MTQLATVPFAPREDVTGGIEADDMRFPCSNLD